jgi:hypothetical protein
MNVYQTARRYNPEDSHLHTHRRENLKSYLEVNIFAACCSPLVASEQVTFMLNVNQDLTATVPILATTDEHTTRPYDMHSFFFSRR